MNNEVTIECLPNSPVDSNCYLIRKGGDCILVDPAQGNGEQLYDLLVNRSLQPQYIIITHEHFDHISSVELLRQKFGCQLVASADCSNRITQAKKNLSLFRDGVGFVCRPADVVVGENGFELRWQGEQVLFYLTPGHSEGGLCFGIGTNLFTGDTVMESYKPVVKLPGGNKAKLKQSIELLMEAFDGDTTIFPGHGEPFPLTAVSTSFLVSQ